MNFELFIVKRIIRSQTGKKSGANTLVNVSVMAIALSMAVMILSVVILTGFKKEIKDKLTGFGSHIQISSLSGNSSWETGAISIDEQLLQQIKKNPEISGVYQFATKPGIVQSGKELQGIILKGVEPGYNWDFFAKNLIKGKLPDLNNPDSLEVLVSKTLASLLKIDVGMKLPTYFVQDPPRMRPFKVAGIYETGLEEYDKIFVYCNLAHIREINNWESGEISGLEIRLSDPSKMDLVAQQIQDQVDRSTIQTDHLLQVKTLKDLAPGFFDFLNLTDTNVILILTLMILIAGFNMISGLLIIILDRMRMIGTLKALGTNNRSMSRIFLYQAGYIILKGLILGNIIGLTLALLQENFRIIPLDPRSYFLDSVPIYINPVHLILLNAGTLVLTLVMMLIPSAFLSRISPGKTIKFD
ncbi:MAG: ABC transporter permease [Bacteroidales bacterium]|nr:ABC transporter permease [Bacteroidales bacterium]